MRRPEAGFTLLETTMVCLLLGIVLAIVGSFLLSANRTVANAATDMSANGEAQDVFNYVDTSLRFAQALSIGGGTVTGSQAAGNEAISGGRTLYVSNVSAPACTVWTLSGSNLTRQVTGQTSGAVLAGKISALTFSANQAYEGLVGVQITIVPGGANTPPVSVSETVSGTNLTRTTLAGGGPALSVGTAQVCTP